MKAAVKVLALMAVLGLVSYALAADAPKTETVKGRVTKVEKDGAQITINAGTRQDPKEVVLTTNDKTKVTLDDKEATIKDIKVGTRITEATVTDGVTTAIKATAATGRGGRGGAPAGGDAPKAPEAPKTN
jgi:hypothetical protein